MRMQSFAIALITALLLSGCGSSASEEPTAAPKNEPAETVSKSIWLDGYTDIADFSYFLDGDELYIKEYKGESRKIRIAPAYEIDAETYHVVSFEDGTFFCAEIDSVIIPNGTRYMANNTFNSSDIKFLYLPASLVELDDTFWGYFHDLEKIYYGGTKEQWRDLCTVDRGDIDVKEIVYEQDPDSLK